MLSLRIALRYLLSRKSHGVVNIISAISIAGVAVATAAIIVILSVFNGFGALAESQFSHIDPDILVTPARGKVIEDADAFASRLAVLPEIATAMPAVVENGLLVAGERQMGAVVVGVGAGWKDIAGMEHILVDGEVLDTVPSYASEAGVDAAPTAVSVGVFSRLGQPAEGFSLYMPRRKGRYNPANPGASFSEVRLIPTALLRTDRMEWDNDHLIVPLSTMRRLLDYTEDQASQIQLRIAEGVSTERALSVVNDMLDDDYIIESREQQQSAGFHMIAIEKWVTFMMLVFILVIASFNIISTLSLLVIEKHDNMSTLRFMGASRDMVRGIFSMLGSLITVAGGVTGIVLGLILALGQQWFGFIKLAGDPSLLSVTAYPVKVEFLDVLAVIGIIIVIALITSQVTRLFTRKID